MANVLVAYYSRSGNTRKVAEAFAEGVKEEGVGVALKKVEDVQVKELLDYDGVALGSPTYYGQMAAPVKKLIDDSIKLHEKLDGKVGAAFTSSGGYGCGGETTVLGILQALLVHGMVVQGAPDGLHYGAIVEENLGEAELRKARLKGVRMARLVKRLFP